MSVKSSTLIAGMLLDNKVRVIQVPASDISVLDIFNEVMIIGHNKPTIKFYTSSKYIKSVGICGLPNSDRPSILNGSDLDILLSLDNPYKKVAGKSKIFHKHVASALESGVVRIIYPKRTLLKSDVVWTDFKVSADPYQLFLIHENNRYYPAIDSDKGYVTFINGNFILYA